MKRRAKSVETGYTCTPGMEGGLVYSNHYVG